MSQNNQSTKRGSAFSTGSAFRKRLRFTVRSLMLLVTLFCVWLGFRVNAARTQRHAVQTVTSLGGVVSYDFHYIDGPPNARGEPTFISRPNRESGVPRWLLAAFGVDFFHSVRSVDLRNTDATDETLVVVRRLSDLRSLYVDGTKVTDAGVRRLNGLKRLDWLTLSVTAVSDEGILSLNDLPELSVFQACETGVTDRAAENLQDRLPTCTTFEIHGPRPPHATVRP